MVPNDTWHGEFGDFDPQYEQESPVQHIPAPGHVFLSDEPLTDEQLAMNAALDALDAAYDLLTLSCAPPSALRELVVREIENAIYELVACGAGDGAR